MKQPNNVPNRKRLRRSRLGYLANKRAKIGRSLASPVSASKPGRWAAIAKLMNSDAMVF